MYHAGGTAIQSTDALPGESPHCAAAALGRGHFLPSFSSLAFAAPPQLASEWH